MEHYTAALKGSPLFAGVEDEELKAMLSCLGARLCTYRKGAYVLRQGDRIHDIVVLVKGALHIQRDDYWGNRRILGHIGVGDMFGEAYAAPNSGPLLNDAVALEDSAAIFLNVERLLTTCSSACRFHTLVVQNLVYAMCEKNRFLVQKLGHMSKRTTREKLLSYLSEEAKRQNRSCFTVPFNRQQLADFLSVDRSAMSGELCKLRDEGLLTFHKSTFTLLQKES